MAQNIEALTLWMAVNTQWRVGMSLVGIDYAVLFQVADRMEIDLSPCVMKKIQRLERHVLNSQGKDKEGSEDSRIQGVEGKGRV